MILIDNQEGLIGDFLGTVPAMQELSKKGTLLIKTRSEISGLFKIAMYGYDYKDYGSFYFSQERKPDIILSSPKSFEISCNHNCYMSQAFMIQAGFEMPKEAPKAHLTFIGTKLETVFDYCISPFARSLPEEQKWPVEKWKELVESRPDLKFALFGNSKYDNKEYLVADNVTPIFDKPFNEVCNILVHSRGLISVVTGTSHLAFHLGKKNVLLTSQTMSWGNNPDAIQIKKPIEQITVQEVLNKL